jgi:hypothetical protein
MDNVDNAVQAVDQRLTPEARGRGQRTVWSVLSSLALHSATVASVLFLITMLQEPPKPGVVDFDTVEFAEDAAQRGGRTDDSTSASNQEVKETAKEIHDAVTDAPESQHDVKKTLDDNESNVLEETDETIKESDDGMKIKTNASDALASKRLETQKRRARALSRQIEALEKAARTRVSQSGVKLKKPGTNTDGSNLFSKVGRGKIIFILDVSGSMGAILPTEGGEFIMSLDYVKLEISGLIRRQLGDDTLFNIISFSTAAQAWEKKLVRANRAGKKSAINYIHSLAPSGGTNVHDALRLAFEDKEVRTIFVLSDGMPSVGELSTDQILRDVRGWNKERRVTIFTVAFIVGVGPRLFLKKLALQNNGIPKAFP